MHCVVAHTQSKEELFLKVKQFKYCFIHIHLVNFYSAMLVMHLASVNGFES